jgi:hypothetical protein
MLENLDFNSIIIIALIILILFIIFCLFAKFIRVAIGLTILLVFVPILYNVFWGDGTDYIKEFSAIFSPRYSQEIQDAYQYYRDKENAVMSITDDTVSHVLNKYGKFSQ